MNELVIRTEEGALTLAPEVEKLVDDTIDLKNDAEQADAELRSAILEAMKENDIQTAKVGKYTFSQVIPKSTVTFDYEAFKKENPNMMEDFSETTETEIFDMEGLKHEFPTIYQRFIKRTKVSVVDTKKLKKCVPAIYQKYATEVMSDKPITLKIVSK